jgi:hypothetical protein
MNMHLHYRIGGGLNFVQYAFQRHSGYRNLHYVNRLHVLESALKFRHLFRVRLLYLQGKSQIGQKKLAVDL